MITVGGKARPTLTPARRLYAAVVDQVQALDVGDRMALARALNDGTRWDDLPENVQMVFGHLAQTKAGGL